MAYNDNGHDNPQFPLDPEDERYRGRLAERDFGTVEPMASGGFVPATPASSKHPSRTSSANTPGMAGQYSRNSMAYQGRSRKSSGKKKALVAVLVVAVIAALAGIGFYAFANMKKEEVNESLHDMEAEEMQAVDAEMTGKTKFDEPFTVLLLGSDEREGDPDMGARTDTIILVRVDPLKNVVNMVSIPRDTMVNIEDVGTTKINAAYTYGGPSGEIAAVKDLTGIDIDHFVVVNFDNLVELVDAIGGIDVYVEEEINDEDAGGWVMQGQQHMNGESALVLARSRAYADGDYTRQTNQRKVILAIIDRVLNAPSTEMTGLISASTGFVTTDSGITFDFLLSLAQLMRNNGNEGMELVINSATLPSSPAYIDDVSYVVADTAGVAEMMSVFEAGGDVSQPIQASSINTDIANAGGTTTPSSTTTSSEEEDYDYDTGYDTGYGNGGNYGYYYE